jgi:hypothetical protein
LISDSAIFFLYQLVLISRGVSERHVVDISEERRTINVGILDSIANEHYNASRRGQARPFHEKALIHRMAWQEDQATAMAQEVAKVTADSMDMSPLKAAADRASPGLRFCGSSPLRDRMMSHRGSQRFKAVQDHQAYHGLRIVLM